MRLTILTAVTAALLLGVIVELLRRRQLREKYAVLWMLTGLAAVALGVFPTLLDSLSQLLGVASGASLVLFLGIVFLLMVCIHLSWEASRLEEETRTLAEDLALLRATISDGRVTPSGRVTAPDPITAAGRVTSAGPVTAAGRGSPAGPVATAPRQATPARHGPSTTGRR